MDNPQQVQKRSDEHSGCIIIVGGTGMNGKMSGHEIGQRFANVGGRHGVNVAGRGGSGSNRGRGAANGGSGHGSGGGKQSRSCKQSKS